MFSHKKALMQDANIELEKPKKKKQLFFGCLLTLPDFFPHLGLNLIQHDSPHLGGAPFNNAKGHRDASLH